MRDFEGVIEIEFGRLISAENFVHAIYRPRSNVNCARIDGAPKEASKASLAILDRSMSSLRDKLSRCQSSALFTYVSLKRQKVPVRSISFSRNLQLGDLPLFLHALQPSPVFLMQRLVRG